MRKCQGTQANVCISFPGMTSQFPHSSQTHKHPRSKQRPISPKQLTAWVRACVPCLAAGGVCMPSPNPQVNEQPYGFLVSSRAVSWICFSNTGKNVAVQRNSLRGTAREGGKAGESACKEAKARPSPPHQPETHPARGVIQSTAARRHN